MVNYIIMVIIGRIEAANKQSKKFFEESVCGKK